MLELTQLQIEKKNLEGEMLSRFLLHDHCSVRFRARLNPSVGSPVKDTTRSRLSGRCSPRHEREGRRPAEAVVWLLLVVLGP
jgi:hypothetical protein